MLILATEASGCLRNHSVAQQCWQRNFAHLFNHTYGFSCSGNANPQPVLDYLAPVLRDQSRSYSSDAAIITYHPSYWSVASHQAKQKHIGRLKYQPVLRIIKYDSKYRKYRSGIRMPAIDGTSWAPGIDELAVELPEDKRLSNSGSRGPTIDGTSRAPGINELAIELPKGFFEAADILAKTGSGNAEEFVSFLDDSGPKFQTEFKDDKKVLPLPKRASEQEPGAGHGRKVVSLLEELFPRGQEYESPRLKNERHIPRLSLDFDLPGSDIESVGTGWNVGPKAPAKTTRKKGFAVLVLRGAGKNLDENDFKRVQPSGKHIEGWTHQGRILRVIRGRDIITLKPDGSYYIVFDSEDDAEAYRQYVERLHRHAVTSSPRSLFSTIPPPPPLRDGENGPYGALESYTLLPPGRSLYFYLYRQPFPPVLRNIFLRDGYPGLQSNDASQPKVLLSVYGHHLSVWHLRRIVRKDGRQRGLQWVTYSGQPKDIRTITVGIAKGETDTVGDQVIHEATEVPDSGEIAPRKIHRGLSWRYIITFGGLNEAKRFVTEWHRRDITDLLGDDLYVGEMRPIVNAELIW